MIVDILANSERIEGLNLYFKMVFDYIKTHDLSSMPAGRIDIDGDNAYLKIEDAKGRRVEEAVYERQDKYIDIQMPLSMSEKMCIRDSTDTFPTKSALAEVDVCQVIF